MGHTHTKRTGRVGKVLLAGVAFLIAIAFLQTAFRSAASGTQKVVVGGVHVTIDVNPGGRKVIDLGSRGDLAVAVLGGKGFDVSTIDVSSLSFAGASITKTHDSGRPTLTDKREPRSPIKFNVAFRDVNNDGSTDLVASFPIPFLRKLVSGTPSAELRGKLLDGRAIEGAQTVQATGESVIKKGGGVNKPGSPQVQFCNPASIDFPDDPPGIGNATPFPSPITVSALTGVVTDVTVTLNDVSHTFPNDLDIILVSPTNQVVVLAVAAFDETDAVAQDLTLSDSAAAYLPRSNPLVTGTYRPTSYFTVTDFGSPAPALTPAAPYAATFKAFRGINPNGVWSLYARDVVAGDTGSIAGGWCIDITTAASAGCANQLFQGSLGAGDTTLTERLFRDSIAGLCGTPKVCPLTALAEGPFFYDTFTVTNNNTVSSCVTATVTGSCNGNLFLSAYAASFNPADVCANYIDDCGTVIPDEIPNSGTSTMSFELAAGASVVFVVNETLTGTGCGAYGLLVEGDICAPVVGCTLTCPANITVSNDPNQCGAVVNYPAPTTTGTCGTVTCSPASGSFFPVGTTTVTCTSSAGPTCTFTVTINDTQPPTITCPANITATTPTIANMCSVVTFPSPTTSDNCPGVTSACTPASGSCFPVGSTTVTCTATDASGNTATCSFSVLVFNVCLQDDSNPATVFLGNSVTGAYRFCCNGTVYTGVAVVTKKGNVVTFQHSPSDRRVQATFDGAVFKGTASLQSPPGSIKCTIGDKDTRNNSCVCGVVAPPPT